MKISQQQFDDIQKKRSASGFFAKPEKKAPMQSDHMKRWQAAGRLPKGQMNKTEAVFAGWLDQQKLAGRVLDWKFHPMRVRLADNTYYEVDFLALGTDMQLTIYETKGGYTSDKGQIKIKLCAEVLPYFRMVKAEKLSAKAGGGWKMTEY